MIDFNLGVKISIIISLIPSIGTIMLFLLFLGKSKNKDLRLFLLSLYQGLTYGIAIFLMIYPVMNSIYHIDIIFNGLMEQNPIIFNVLLQRITVIIIGFFLLKGNSIFLRSWLKLWYFKSEGAKKNHFPIDFGRSEFDFLIEWRNISQIAIYGISAIILETIGIMNGGSLTLISILNFVLLFIVDDWNIIHDYTKKFEEEIISIHKKKINIANGILVILTLVISWIYFEWGIALLNSFVIIVSVYWRYFYDKTSLLKNLELQGNIIPKENIKGNLIIVPNEMIEKDKKKKN